MDEHSITIEPQGRWVEQAQHRFSAFHGERPKPITLLVIHNISLPAGLFDAPYIDQMFLGCVQTDVEILEQVKALKVSAHLLIKRNGTLIQYVPFDRCAWHAGVSCFDGEDNCNDFSIGIELEGGDSTPYTTLQYRQLIAVTKALQSQYPKITNNRIVGHSDIAPGRKTDPGPAFDWVHYRQALEMS